MNIISKINFILQEWVPPTEPIEPFTKATKHKKATLKPHIRMAKLRNGTIKVELIKQARLIKPPGEE